MSWGTLIGVLILALSIVGMGFVIEESLRIRDCKVQILDFKSDKYSLTPKKVFRLKISNPTLLPVNVKRIEVYWDVETGSGKKLTYAHGFVTGKYTIKPGSNIKIDVPMKIYSTNPTNPTNPTNRANLKNFLFGNLEDELENGEIRGVAYASSILGDVNIPFSMKKGY